MTGDGWPSVIGGGNCTTATDCNSKGNVSTAPVYAAKMAWLPARTAISSSSNAPPTKTAPAARGSRTKPWPRTSSCWRVSFAQNSAGGCDACAANLMSLWCGLVCSPEQDQFMHMAHEWPSTNYRQDPMTGKEKVKVLELNVALAKEMTCGAVGHGEYITLAFNASKDKSFDHDVLKCSNYSEVVETRETPPDPGSTAGSIASKSTDDKQCPCAFSWSRWKNH
ncbi:Niemann-Pick C1, N-terminal [Phytophthora cactorum]|nr:Niemann-Pick C1, N-terminal [Phytophthora cactorum]